jgi:hypothetical protein
VALLGAAIVAPLAAAPAPVTAASGVGTCSNGWQEVYIPDGSFNDNPQGVITRGGFVVTTGEGKNYGPIQLLASFRK